MFWGNRSIRCKRIVLIVRTRAPDIQFSLLPLLCIHHVPSISKQYGNPNTKLLPICHCYIVLSNGKPSLSLRPQLYFPTFGFSNKPTPHIRIYQYNFLMIDINFGRLRFADMNNKNINYKPIQNIWFLAVNLSYILNVVVD